MRHQVTGFSNPLVKELRALRDKKHRRRQGRFLAEGLRLLLEGLDCGHVPDTLVLASGRDHHPRMAELEDAVVRAGGRVVETSPDILARITGKDNPQAVAGAYREFPRPLAALDRDAAPLWLVAHELRDPGNLGTMLRTGDATGAGGLILIGDCVDPFSVEAVRASMGAIFTQAVALAGWTEFHDWLRHGHGQLVAASLREAVHYREAPYAAPCFLLIGNESRGLPQEVEAACDLRVTMPMRGRADSLNAAIAAAVLAYEVRARIG
ncbi:RNA methyltransferase [Erythrobacteraceae bacterium CFH 75059]|uniref:TrmH family RNA methyltransferase n=1 Tax=Qipengyuania thermophila TaxID=2509361 RepID=UPI00101FF1A6|nr:RNA methyltransferase [Qipengyuania thermophila]TCD02278.1 RNA methyltransferase [Erythrobacteraceae bacterium CFH 75059]